VAEALSYVSYAGMQRRLLRSGSVDVPLVPMTGITVAGNAIQNTLPAGIVLAGAYSFRQYRRYGADDILAGWVVVGVTVVSFATLATLAMAGLATGFGSGSALNLVWVILGVAVLALLIVVAVLQRAVWLPTLGRLLRVAERIAHRPPGHVNEVLDRWLERLVAIHPSRSDWVAAVALGFGNWLADLGCLMAAFLAVGADVPWRGLLLAYGAGQLASSLPVTPGGLGVVEGSLTVALVAFGGAEASTVAAVLLYRVLSFWAMLPIGWGAWGGMKLVGRTAVIRHATPKGAAA
jgi:putative heme transporter